MASNVDFDDDVQKADAPRRQLQDEVNLFNHDKHDNFQLWLSCITNISFNLVIRMQLFLCHNFDGGSFADDNGTDVR